MKECICLFENYKKWKLNYKNILNLKKLQDTVDDGHKIYNLKFLKQILDQSVLIDLDVHEQKAKIEKIYNTSLELQ